MTNSDPSADQPRTAGKYAARPTHDADASVLLTGPEKPDTRDLIVQSGARGRTGNHRLDTPHEDDENNRQLLADLIEDLRAEFPPKPDGTDRLVMARYGRIIGIEPDDTMNASIPEGSNPGWRINEDYGLLLPSRKNDNGRRWHARISAMPTLTSNVDASPGVSGGLGGSYYDVEPITPGLGVVDPREFSYANRGAKKRAELERKRLESNTRIAAAAKR